MATKAECWKDEAGGLHATELMADLADARREAAEVFDLEGYAPEDRLKVTDEWILNRMTGSAKDVQKMLRLLTLAAKVWGEISCSSTGQR